MGTTVKAKVIERLKSNPPIGAWVKTGKNLHEGKDICEFCGNPLPSGLLSQLNDHFSDDYENLINDIRKQQSSVESQKIVITLPDTANLYSDLQKEYTEIKERLLVEIQAANEQLENFIKHLETKKEKVFDELLIFEVIHDCSNLIGENKLLNNVIRAHNLRTQEFEKEKTAALNQLLKHYASLFVQKEKLSTSKKRIAELETTIGSAVENVRNADKKVKEIETKLSETVKGAETINKHLGQYFGKGDIVVKVTPDNKFQLLRGGKIAKNLSEGEKTTIAFAYFCTKVDEKNNVLADTVIYIDDPISSLDANHLFNTYSFIRNKFYDDASRMLKCKQLFISTHNY
ncbi:AAA domain-containing protein [Geobacter argillaceus]|uniref:AAA domain-containing protein n=1 Tax=Geobacter argillaceus TaxID=345631 RepID=A0A562V5J3_9BACT|nr:AAA domain-containing protein [Geobacter argillaceus]